MSEWKLFLGNLPPAAQLDELQAELHDRHIEPVKIEPIQTLSWCPSVFVSPSFTIILFADPASYKKAFLQLATAYCASECVVALPYFSGLPSYLKYLERHTLVIRGLPRSLPLPVVIETVSAHGQMLALRTDSAEPSETMEVQLLYLREDSVVRCIRGLSNKFIGEKKISVTLKQDPCVGQYSFNAVAVQNCMPVTNLRTFLRSIVQPSGSADDVCSSLLPSWLFEPKRISVGKSATLYLRTTDGDTATAFVELINDHAQSRGLVARKIVPECFALVRTARAIEAALSSAPGK